MHVFNSLILSHRHLLLPVSLGQLCQLHSQLFRPETIDFSITLYFMTHIKLSTSSSNFTSKANKQTNIICRLPTLPLPTPQPSNHYFLFSSLQQKSSFFHFAIPTID